MSAHGGDKKEAIMEDPYLASEDVPLSDGGNYIKGAGGNNLASNEIGEAQNSLAPQKKQLGATAASMIQSAETLMIGK